MGNTALNQPSQRKILVVLEDPDSHQAFNMVRSGGRSNSSAAGVETGLGENAGK